MSEKPKTPVPARPASTVVILRDGADGIEVFMVVRHHEIDFASGALVFPGGKVDAEDSDAAWSALAPSVPAAPDRAFFVAAGRETFEEAGLMLARRQGTNEIIEPDAAHGLVETYRAALLKGDTTFVDIIRRENLVLAGDLMVPFAHWITPEPVPKRFDTHFFLVAAPMAQLGQHDGSESVEGLWITPQEALREAEAGTRTLVFATRMNLEKLARYRTVAEAVDVTRSRPVVTVTPKILLSDSGRRLQIPAEADYGVTEVFVEEGSRLGTAAHRG
ncbi:MAG: NUDIX hydrolase [Hyphomonadaceae bacterium]|jgi:8-oxo-dGTP pyrophosphatase MutT (NUDIX family)|nr:NUDIX hydrolase [Hyphomonadaceae bacterium]